MAQEYINIDEALSRIRGNKKLYRRMLTLFDNSEEFDKLEALLQEGDYPKAGDVAHAIKGMTGNLSMTALFEASTRLMNELRQSIYDESSIADYRDALKKTRERAAEIGAQFDSEGA